ncbi:MAG TPA: hypothetical protein VN704_09985 [Verrucomicrobiae bacterium]|nr:hypothetical protein [Verrucomicrobiae bacterium]
MFKFNLQSENLSKIKKNIFLLSDLEKYFGLGFSVKQFEKFSDKDHSIGPFELVAYRDTEVFIFIILGNDLQNNISRTFELDYAVKIIDKETTTFGITL